MAHTTREAWLMAAVPALAKIITAAGGPTFKEPRISVGFCSTGLRSKRIGECWAKQKDDRCQIFLVPQMDKPVQVLDVLIHELVHASVGSKAGHGPVFKKVAVAAGLTGAMRSTTAGPELKAKLVELSKQLGTFPHHALANAGNERKKQSTRMLKYTCPECEQIIRACTDSLDCKCNLCGVNYELA
jgi:hypothetical protein